MGLGSTSVENAGSNGSYERFDDDGVPYVKATPTTCVVGEFDAIRYFTGGEDNGGYDRGYIGIVLSNPSLLDLPAEVTDNEGGTEDQTVIVSDSNIAARDDDFDTAREYVRDGNSGSTSDAKAVNPSDQHTELVDDVGVEIGGFGSPSLYKGEEGSFEDLEADQIILTISGASSWNVARTLDVDGATAANMASEGSDRLVNTGLVEYPPSDADPDKWDSTAPRFARNPESRDDLEGEEIGVLLQRREEVDPDYAEAVENGDQRGMYWTTVFEIPDGDTTEELAEDAGQFIVDPTDEFEPTSGNSSYLVWRYDQDGADHNLTQAEVDAIDSMVANINEETDTDDLDDGTLRELVEDNSDQFQSNEEEIVSVMRNRL